MNGIGIRFVDVAASNHSSISAAQGDTGRVFMWGLCRSQAITLPMMTQFSTTDEVFASFSDPPVTWRMFNVETVKGYRIAESMAAAFDTEETSDIKFIIEDKTVHAHKAILQIRCAHFRQMFQSHWTEGIGNSVKITEFSYNVYRAFLKFLYTDDVDLQPEEALDLLDLSNSYDEKALAMKCETVIREGISVENAAMLYAAALKFNAKFALNHMTVVTRTDAFKQLDAEVIKGFIDAASNAGAFKT